MANAQLRSVAARVHRRSTAEGEERKVARIVTFFSGNVQREPLIDLDDEGRRLVYGATDSPLGATHYNAAVRVLGDGEHESSVEWVIDVLPNELGAVLEGLMDRAAEAMQRS